jgi:hypothetical protein
MLTAYESNKLRLIKQAALDGRASEVSRADKQWVLDIAARNGTVCKMEMLKLAELQGYNVKNIPVLL